MTEKRYAIIRVDKDCPNRLEKLSAPCITSRKRFDCKNCRYGDTKEQLIRKIVQVLLRRFKSYYKGNFITVEMAEQQYLEIAKEIVEFLGVE